MANISGISPNTPWGNSIQAPSSGLGNPANTANRTDIAQNITPTQQIQNPSAPTPEPNKPLDRRPQFAPNSWESYSTRPRVSIRTYQADTADLMQSQPISLAHITITEQSRGTNSQIIRNTSSTRDYSAQPSHVLRTISYSLLSVGLIFGSVLLLTLGLSRYNFNFLSPGINDLADNFAGKIYNFLGITKTNPQPSPTNTGSDSTKPPVFGNITNKTNGTGTTGTPNDRNNSNNRQTSSNTSGSSFIIRGIIKVDYGIDALIQRGATFSTIVRSALGNRTLNSNELLGVNVYNPKDDGTTSYLTAQQMLIAIASRAPDTIRKALSDDFVIGYSGPNNAPFVILTTNEFAKAYAGMLAWETSLYDDFATIFSLPIYEVASNVQKPVYNYKDELILSRDVRVLEASGNKPSLYYTFVDKNTILMTTSDATTKKIIEVLDLGAYIRQK